MAKQKDEISREAYREMYHKTAQELRCLKQSIVDGSAYEDELWDEAEATVGDAEGYYRFGRSSNGHYWVRFKWTTGPQMGRYSIGGHTTLRNAFLACQEDVDRVLSGKKIAPLDMGYKGKAK